MKGFEYWRVHYNWVREGDGDSGEVSGKLEYETVNSYGELYRVQSTTIIMTDMYPEILVFPFSTLTWKSLYLAIVMENLTPQLYFTPQKYN